jgi:hypothetical protein
MNAKLLLPLLAFVAAGAAHAETPTVVKDDFISTQTRAEVQADLVAFKQAGANPWSTTYNPLRTFVSKASRQDVTAAYIASRDEVAAVNSEDGGAAYYAQGGQRGVTSTTLAGTPTRAQ